MLVNNGLLVANNSLLVVNNGLLVVNNGLLVVNNGLLVVNNGLLVVNNGILVVNNGILVVDNGLLVVNNGLLVSSFIFYLRFSVYVYQRADRVLVHIYFHWRRIPELLWKHVVSKATRLDGVITHKTTIYVRPI